jgi:hypothetical protein
MQYISTLTKEIGYFSKAWSISKINTKEDLIQIIKTKAYSNAIFLDGNRSIKNIIGFSDFFILDIDNYNTNFTINDCEDLFIINNVASLITPNRSHKKEKK